MSIMGRFLIIKNMVREFYFF